MSTTTFVDEPSNDNKHMFSLEKEQFIDADATSITSSTTLGAQELSFQPANYLHINAKGISLRRPILPSSELETTVHNPDGSIAYRSIRAKACSGSCVLSDAEGLPLVKTEYFWGPCRDPILYCLDSHERVASEIKTVSTWMSRSHQFPLPDGRTLRWEYKKEKGFGAKGSKGTALVLTLEGKRIAALIRNDETRTPGSNACSAGNGGELALSEEVGEKSGIGEELVVATCLLMLKKEIDRGRS